VAGIASGTQVTPALGLGSWGVGIDPLALATLALKDAPGNWTREKTQAAMSGSTSVRIDLARPIDVLILYATALATEAEPVMFFDDIYDTTGSSSISWVWHRSVRLASSVCYIPTLGE
jgi:murein L,D-transpeptidase YcbB/YkuD